MCSRGSPVRNASRPAAAASCSVSAAEPETIPIERIRSGADAEQQRLAPGRRAHARVQLVRRDAAPGTVRGTPIGVPL